jgi:hypothetical protein
VEAAQQQACQLTCPHMPLPADRELPRAPPPARIPLRGHSTQLLVAAGQHIPRLTLEQVAALGLPQFLLLQQQQHERSRQEGKSAAGANRQERIAFRTATRKASDHTVCPTERNAVRSSILASWKLS